METNELIDATIQSATGGKTIDELAALLVNVSYGEDVTKEDIIEFLSDLIASNILVSNLAPPVTGTSALDHIIHTLSVSGAAPAKTAVLNEIRSALDDISASPLGLSAAPYRELRTRLKALDVDTNEEADLFQVDLHKPVEAVTLPWNIARQLENSLEILRCLTVEPEDAYLQQFRDRFSRRYDRAWVPLLEVLDEDSGIGFGPELADISALTREVTLAPAVETAGLDVARDPLWLVVLQKLATCALDAGEELLLDASDLPRPPASNRLPSTLALVVTVAADSVAAIERGDFAIHVIGGDGPSGARWLARFCHLQSDLDEAVRGHLRLDEAQEPDALYAELVFLPEGRLGNVVSRPVLRDAELVYLGQSGAPKESTVPISDVLVTVTEDGKTILLYSHRLKKRIIPRLTNAHNTNNLALPAAYRFLAALQTQHSSRIPRLGWTGRHVADYLPRVRLGHIVLCLATWRVSEEEVKTLVNGSVCEAFCRMQQFRAKRALPRFVVFAEGDAALTVDLDNVLSIDALLQVLQRAGSGVLREVYPPAGRDWLRGPEGGFRHQLIVPFAQACADGDDTGRAGGPSEVAVSRALRRAQGRTASEIRSYPPGGEWLYVRVYGGWSALDRVVREALPGFMSSAAARVRGDWFFLRFADPESHLRLRFRGDSGWLHAELLPALRALLLAHLSDGAVSRFDIVNYQPEIERYGGNEGMAVAERVFTADSNAVVGILSALERRGELDSRWLFALCGVNLLLVDAGLGLGERLAFCRRLRNASQQRFDWPGVKRGLGDAFRKRRSSLVASIRETESMESVPPDLRLAFETRSTENHAAFEQLRRLEADEVLSTSLADLLASFVHLHVNRMLESDTVRQEYVLYDFLARLLEGEEAKLQRADRH